MTLVHVVGRWARRLLFYLVLLLAVVLFADAAFAKEVTLLVDGAAVSMDVPPMIEDGRTLVPVRAPFEQMGAEVEWLASEKQVTVRYGEREVVLYIGQQTFYVDGVAKQFDAPPRIVDGRTLVPVRFVSESFDFQVEWDGPSYTVSITTVAPLDPRYQEMAESLLSLLNEQREELGYAPLQAVASLSAMARSHAADMAKAGFFSHTSPTAGSLSQRAAAHQLTTPWEFIVSGQPYVAKILAACLAADSEQALLAEENRFLGIAIYPGTSGAATDLYAVVTLANGEGLLSGALERTTTASSVVINGYTADKALPLLIYQLDPNDSSKYISRRSVSISAVAADGQFSQTVNLWAEGTYLVCLGQDSRLITYRQ